ncbi:Phage XkdN-like tail assembly chaperone protein, TAC [Amphibacillus marinus]|uniref:Phage XkdN-like tail assembly chaperone protein, TAC n=1 Tax=Amphibacillus marinus TaxID=872970 RepID=A0A1H8J000_9BACI|nr:hypothetical protein [Amphibacillus marinus]SEN73616.1 Phage XkdN-like tail assembly chaperone protein, TAC [Amphibacillus marinus]
MSSLQDFMLENTSLSEKEVKLPRFKSPFVIKAISEAENTALRKKNTVKVKGSGGQLMPRTDSEKYMGELVASCIVIPDLADKKLQEHYGTLGSKVDTLRSMLLAGEFATITNEIQSINGFDIELDELREEVKND